MTNNSNRRLVSSRSIFALIIAIGLLPAALDSTEAGGPQFWRVDTSTEFASGEASGVSIAGNGTVTLAPAVTTVFDTKQAHIWSAVADRAGNIYLGAGNDGRIFRVDPSGKGALLYQAPELNVMALAVDAGGTLFAGTSPDGKVYRISQAGEARVFFEPRTRYIWSLAFDPQGRLLVGTGDKGVIFRVNSDGTGAPLATTTQANITNLRVDATGTIIAGTDPGGMVLRIDPSGRIFTLFDSPLREIRDLEVAPDGSIFALALAESAGSGATNAAPAPASSTPGLQLGGEGSVTVTIGDLQVVDSPTSSSSSSSGASSGGESRSALYRIAPGGAWRTVWESREATAFASILSGDGRLLVGTGQNGRILAIPDQPNDRTPALHARLPEAQASRFIRAGNRVYAASSNLGRLFLLSAETAAEGSLTSFVHDARNHSTWGRLARVGDGLIEISTRSGNTSAPDQTWSDWSPPLADGAPITSPAARYLQWRAVLKRSSSAPAPSLREVTISYLPTNLAPRISSLSLLPVGVSLQPTPAQQIDGVADYLKNEAATIASIQPMPPRRTFQRGAISLQWQADDPNGDGLEYSLLFRELSGSTFYPLHSGFRETFHTIDASELPDGRYIFRLVASDRLSNPDVTAISVEAETEPVTIDNTPPGVSPQPPAISGSRAELAFRASDASSIIRRAEYQIDGGSWLTIFPHDGLADSREELFKLSLPLADSRPHSVAFRVIDANLNIGTAQLTVRAN